MYNTFIGKSTKKVQATTIILRRNHMKKFLAIFVALVLLASCSSGSDGDKVILRVGSGADPASFDPHGKNDQPSSRVRKNIYEALIYQDENLNIQPLLAKSWDVDSTGTVWTFALQEGVVFHNGEKFDSEDAVFSLNRGKNSTQVNFLLASVKEIRAVDEYTIEIELEYPYAPILNNLAHPTMAMLDKGTVEKQGDNYASTYDGNIPVGTAPFKFASYSQGSEIRLVRNEEYWNEEWITKVDEVIFKPYPDNSARKLALEGGDVDIAYDIAPSDVPSLRSNKNVDTVEYMDLSYAYMGFNMKLPKFQDVRVRKAINLAIDVNPMIESRTILNNMGQEPNSPIAPLAFGWTDIDPYGYDPEQAKALLKEAGAENLSFVIWTNENPLRVQAATVAQAQLAEVGITATIKQMEWGAYLDGTAAGDHEVFILGWTTVTGDADYGLQPLFHTDNWGAAGNRTFYSNKKVDTLLEEGRKETSPEKRLAIYKEAQELIMADYPNIPLWYMNRVQAVRSNVKGFVPHPAGHFSLYSVYFED